MYEELDDIEDSKLKFVVIVARYIKCLTLLNDVIVELHEQIITNNLIRGDQ